MPIKASCQCGQSFAAPDNLAGRTVRCPKCGSPLLVPGGQAGGAPQRPAQQRPAAQQQRPSAPTQQRQVVPNRPATSAAGGLGGLLDEAGITAYAGPRCPKCNSPLLPATAICVKCGFNTATGQSITSEVKQGGKGDAHGGAAEYLLNKAATEIDKAPPPPKETTGGKLAEYGLALGMIIVVSIVGYGAWAGFQKIETSGKSFYYAGLVVMVAGSIANAASGIAQLYYGFKESATKGLMVMFIPFYGWYHCIIVGQGFWVMLNIMGSVMAGVGYIMFIYFEAGDPQLSLVPLNILRQIVMPA